MIMIYKLIFSILILSLVSVRSNTRAEDLDSKINAYDDSPLGYVTRKETNNSIAGFLHPHILSLEPYNKTLKKRAYCFLDSIQCPFKLSTKTNSYYLNLDLVTGASISGVERAKPPAKSRANEGANRISDILDESYAQSSALVTPQDSCKDFRVDIRDEGRGCSKEDCRVFEDFEYNSRSYTLGVGESYFCLMKYKFNSTIKNDFESQERIGYPIVRNKLEPGLRDSFKYTTLTAFKSRAGMTLMRFLATDESGILSSLILNMTDNKWLDFGIDVLSWSSSLSLIQLPKPKHREVSRTIWDSNRADIQKKAASSLDLDELRFQYDHSYVEAISLVPGNILCWSTGLGVPLGEDPIRNCQDSLIKMMGSDELTSSVVFAYTEYEFSDGSIYSHLVYAKRQKISTGGQVEIIGPETYYVRCKDNTCDQRKQISAIPTDIVSYKTKDCHKLVIFYPNSLNITYKIVNPGQSILDIGPIATCPSFWNSKSAINAIMYSNSVFYFFLPSNVLVTYEVSRGESCSSILFGSRKIYRISEFFRKQSPNGERPKFTFTGKSDYMESIGWSSDIRESPKQIDDSQIVIWHDRDTGSFSVILIAILVIITLLVILFFLLGYIKFMGSKHKESRRQQPTKNMSSNSNNSFGSVKTMSSSDGRNKSGKKSPLKSKIRSKQSPRSMSTVRTGASDL